MTTPIPYSNFGCCSSYNLRVEKTVLQTGELIVHIETKFEVYERFLRLLYFYPKPPCKFLDEPPCIKSIKEKPVNLIALPLKPVLEKTFVSSSP